MDAVDQNARSSSWSPEKRRDGGVEIGVNYFNENSQRMSFDSVSLQCYIELWDAGLLKHQQEAKAKPEHLPSREEVLGFLEQEKSKPPTLPSIPLKPAGVTTSIPAVRREKAPPKPHEIQTRETVEKRLQMLRDAAQKVQGSSKPRTRASVADSDREESHDALPYKPKAMIAAHQRPRVVARTRPDPVQTQAVIDDVPESVVDACAANIPKLSERSRETIRAALAGKKSIEGLTEGSFVVQFGDVCNQLGIPKTGQRSGPSSRRAILRRVYTRYEQLVAEGTLLAAIRSASEIDRELRALLREMNPEEKERLFKYLRSRKAGE